MAFWVGRNSDGILLNGGVLYRNSRFSTNVSLYIGNDTRLGTKIIVKWCVTAVQSPSRLLKLLPIKKPHAISYSLFHCKCANLLPIPRYKDSLVKLPFSPFHPSHSCLKPSKMLLICQNSTCTL